MLPLAQAPLGTDEHRGVSGGESRAARAGHTEPALIRESHERCRQGRPLIARGGDPLPACALVAWLDWSDKLWAARRLFPVSAYFGDAGIDKRELALMMYQNKAEERATRRQGHKQTDAMRRQALEKLIP